jgi:cytoskeletal protein CcmA (bactofilin family)
MAEDNSGKGLNTIIGKGSTFEGTLNVMNSLRIEGVVRGKIKCTDVLTVGHDGMIEADVEVKSAILSGKIVGNVEAADRVELEATASLHGDIVTKQLIISEGAFFKGSCEMNVAKEPAEGEPAAAAQ